jgi:hypothetical protein
MHHFQTQLQHKEYSNQWHMLRHCRTNNVTHVFKLLIKFTSALHVSGFLLAHLQRQVYNFGSGSSLLVMVISAKALTPYPIIMSFGCSSSTPILVQLADITRTHYTKCRMCSASWGWVSDTRNIYGPVILNKLNEKCITLVLQYRYTAMHGQRNINFRSKSKK